MESSQQSQPSRWSQNMSDVTKKTAPIWETLAESGHLADAMVEVVRERGNVTLVELNRECDADWRIACSTAREGECGPRLPAVPSTRRAWCIGATSRTGMRTRLYGKRCNPTAIGSALIYERSRSRWLT